MVLIHVKKITNFEEALSRVTTESLCAAEARKPSYEELKEIAQHYLVHYRVRERTQNCCLDTKHVFPEMSNS